MKLLFNSLSGWAHDNIWLFKMLQYVENKPDRFVWDHLCRPIRNNIDSFMEILKVPLKSYSIDQLNNAWNKL